MSYTFLKVEMGRTLSRTARGQQMDQETDRMAAKDRKEEERMTEEAVE